MKKSELEETFFSAWKLGRPDDSWELPVRQHRFDQSEEKRRWKFDFAWLSLWVAIEVQGGQWIRGGHNTGSGMQKDCEKRNAATEQGWRVFYLTTSDLSKANIGNTIRRVIGWLESAWNAKSVNTLAKPGKPATAKDAPTFTARPATASTATTTSARSRKRKPAKLLNK